MKKSVKIIVFSFLIYFASWCIVYFSGLNDHIIQSEDTVPALFIPVTIINEQTLYVDTYYEFMRDRYPHPDDKSYEIGLTPFYLRKVGNNYITAFPIITGILALPVFIAPLLFNMSITWLNLGLLGHLAAALIMSISGGMLYLLLKRHFKLDKKKSTLLLITYLFGTINFAVNSQALWQHGTLQLFFVLYLYYLYEEKYLLSGLSLGLAVLSRPTAIFIAPFLGLLLIHKLYLKNKQNILSKSNINNALKFFAGLALMVLFFIWYTKNFYQDISNNGYADQLFVNWLSRFPEGFLGIWISPSKGILIYSPIFIFAIAGIIKTLKNKRYKTDEYFKYFIFTAIVIVHTLILGKWKHWYGGWSFGYRMASDIIPFLILLIVPVLNSKKSIKVFTWLLVFSIAVQIFGLIFYDGVWHAAYDDGFVDTAWLWSLKDSELVFNIRRILVKLGWIERACPTCLPQ